MGKKNGEIRGVTAKGLGVREGQIITRRWALRYGEKVVYVYCYDKDDALQTGMKHFRPIGGLLVHVEPAGHIEWKILDKGLNTERAVQKSVFYAGHDVTELIDRQHDYLGKQKGKKK